MPCSAGSGAAPGRHGAGHAPASPPATARHRRRRSRPTTTHRCWCGGAAHRRRHLSRRHGLALFENVGAPRRRHGDDRAAGEHRRAKSASTSTTKNQADRGRSADPVRPPGDDQRHAILREHGAPAGSSTARATEPEQPAERQHHRHGGAAPAERQPAGARPEVDHAQPGREFDPHHRRRAPDRHQPGNIVPSYKVADATISYGGQGFVAAANRLGWLSRFFNSGWEPY